MRQSVEYVQQVDSKAFRLAFNDSVAELLMPGATATIGSVARRKLKARSETSFSFLASTDPALGAGA
jgi:hypothetical protein